MRHIRTPLLSLTKQGGSEAAHLSRTLKTSQCKIRRHCFMARRLGTHRGSRSLWGSQALCREILANANDVFCQPDSSQSLNSHTHSYGVESKGNFEHDEITTHVPWQFSRKTSKGQANPSMSPSKLRTFYP